LQQRRCGDSKGGSGGDGNSDEGDGDSDGGNGDSCGGDDDSDSGSGSNGESGDSNGNSNIGNSCAVGLLPNLETARRERSVLRADEQNLLVKEEKEVCA
jgi:hypothetical protein